MKIGKSFLKKSDNVEIEEAMIARRKLDVIVPNVFHGNAGKLADWASASHVERAAQKKAVPIPPQQRTA